MPEPSRVLILAPNWVGDAVMALPAIRDVRVAFPSARIIVAARRAVADVFRLAPHVDEVVTLGWNGRWWKPRAFHADVRLLRSAEADVALLLPNSFAAAWLVARAGVPDRWGYSSDMRRRLLSRPVRRPKGTLHQGAYYQHLTSELGIARGPLEPELAVSDRAVASARALLRNRGWDGKAPFVVLAPGAAYGTAKRWIPANVARLIDDLVRRGRVCVLVGTPNDAATARSVTSHIDPDVASRVIDLTGQTTLEDLAAVLALGSGCVANDSGAMHLAGAMGTPLVAVFGPTNEHATAPLKRASGRAEIVTHPVWCRPCMLRECPIDHRCMKGITPQRVLAALEGVMRG